jgi:hypothetical protein
MNLFAVFKEGVYRHECGGIFGSKGLAVLAAEKLRDGESDDYHSYSIVPFNLDVITQQEPLIEKTRTDGNQSKYMTGGELLEPEMILDVGTKKV